MVIKFVLYVQIFKDKGNTPILALLKEKEEEKEVLHFYTSKGKVFDDKESALDLFIEEDDEWVYIVTGKQIGRAHV